jgi:hypothetical protein
MISAVHRPIHFDAHLVRDAAQHRWPEILRQLNIAVPSTPKQHGPCPACGGTDRFRFDDEEGKGTWFCNQCSPKAGDGFALVQNVKRVTFPEAVQMVAGCLGLSPTSESGKKIVKTYDYTDESGSLIFQVVRFEPKDFRQRRPDGHGGWIWNLKDIEPVLYRLCDVMPASTVLIVEGEKDVDTAYQLGLPDGWAATCNPMGAGKWRDCYSDALLGTHAVILPDVDGPAQKYAGQKHANQVAESLRSKAAEVSCLELPDGSKDLSEWAVNRTSEDLVHLLTQAKPWEPIPIPDTDSDTPTNGHAGTRSTTSGMSVQLSDEWPEIQPVKAELLSVPLLPLQIVPDVFREFVKDVSDRMQCPPDYVAASMMVMAGTVTGAGCGIRPKKHDDWLVVPNFWGAVVGRPSMLKTPAISEAMKPLAALEAEAKAAYDHALKDHVAELEAFKAQREALQQDMRSVAKGKTNSNGHTVATMESLKYDFARLEEPKAPVWRRYKTNDATIEKLAALQSENPRGLLLFRDELVGQLAIWDKEDHQSDRAFFLEGFNGLNSYTADRIGRGHIHTPHNCVSLFGGIQPTKLTSYLYAAMRGHNNDGLVQRLQVLVYPDEPATWALVDTPINVDAKQTAYQAIQRLAMMDFRQHGAYGEEGRIPYYHFDEAGQTVFYEWLTELEGKLRKKDEEPVVLEHLGKYRSLMPSFALVSHLLALATDPAHAPRQVSQEHALCAAAWCGYLEQHARRIYGLVTNATQQAASRLASKLQQGAFQDEFTIRDVLRKDWSLLQERPLVEKACDELVALGWLREKVTPTAQGQRGKTAYVINPKVRRHGQVAR